MSNAKVPRREFLAAVSTGLALSGSADAAGSLKLAANGRSDYAIVIAPDASLSERHGAEELQRFLKEISGASLPITAEPQPKMVLIGDSPALRKLRLDLPLEEMGQEGFALRTAGRHLVIAGGRLRGSMYGVYAFLEKLGCRWFTADVSRIPRMHTISVGPMNELQKPAFEYREPFFTEAMERNWAVRNKTNGSFQDIDDAAGGRIRYYPFVHTFEALVPPDRYFKEHPEYFALVDGKRRSIRSQLCLTNPDVLRISVETVERWIAAHPEATIFSVSQNDCYGYCECENCRRVEQEEGGAHSGPLLRFVNAVAEQIEAKHPGKLIDTLAYQYTEAPPSKVRPRRNVRIRLCPIGACEAHPYEQCPHNAYFMKNLWAWSQITGRLYVWHYNTNFLNYLLPFPDFDELIADIPMYKRHGVVGLFMEGDIARGGGAENAELRSYVMAKLLWDVNADAARAIDEFHEACYGKAAKAMRAYFDLAHRQVRLPPSGPGSHLWIYDRPTAPYLNAVFLDQAEKLFGEAESAADNNDIRRRVRKARLGIDYTRLMLAKEFRIVGDSYEPRDLAALKDRWQSFLTRVREFGIQNLTEWTQLPRDDQDFSTFVRPYRAVTLENERLRVHVVPELGGRITHLIDKRSGRDLLRRPDPGAKQYPNAGGLTLAAYSDYQTPVAGTTKWVLDPGASAQQASFTGVCENGLRMRSTLRLGTSALHIEAVLENTTGAALEGSVQSNAEFDAGDLKDVVVSYRRQDGQTVRRELISPEMEPAGSEFYEGGEQPDGEWRVVNSAGGLAIVNRFPGDRTGRCFLRWTLKSGDNAVVLALASLRRQLQPGERVTLEAEYGTD